MTLKEITEKLCAAGVPDAEFDAVQLVAAAMKISTAAARTGEDFSSPLLCSMVEKRMARCPLQYIIGEWDFYGYTFRLTPDCLIPRADTELLCSHLIETLPQGGTFADLCTGSGCIAVSALLRRPDAPRAVAVELYPKTADVARENSHRLGTDSRLEILCRDVRDGIPDGEKFDVIVSNPPYVTADEMGELSPEVRQEPSTALTDGGDGLSILRRIIDIYPDSLRDGGTLAVEIGWRQGAALSEYAVRRGLRPTILKDSGGRDRVVTMKKA